MIEYLLKNAEKFNIGIIDDREHHDRIEFHFNKIYITMNNKSSFYGVKTLIYFTDINEIDVTLEDEELIGHIGNIRSIDKIIDLTNMKTIYKNYV